MHQSDSPRPAQWAPLRGIREQDHLSKTGLPDGKFPKNKWCFEWESCGKKSMSLWIEWDHIGINHETPSNFFLSIFNTPPETTVYWGNYTYLGPSNGGVQCLGDGIKVDERMGIVLLWTQSWFAICSLTMYLVNQFQYHQYLKVTRQKSYQVIGKRHTINTKTCSTMCNSCSLHTDQWRWSPPSGCPREARCCLACLCWRLGNRMYVFAFFGVGVGDVVGWGWTMTFTCICTCTWCYAGRSSLALATCASCYVTRFSLALATFTWC